MPTNSQFSNKMAIGLRHRGPLSPMCTNCRSILPQKNNQALCKLLHSSQECYGGNATTTPHEYYDDTEFTFPFCTTEKGVHRKNPKLSNRFVTSVFLKHLKHLCEVFAQCRDTQENHHNLQVVVCDTNKPPTSNSRLAKMKCESNSTVSTH
jgi:hypothetical protein